MSTLQTIIEKSKDEYVSGVIGDYSVKTMTDWIENKLKESYLAGQQSVLECARGMKIPKEFESKWNYYQGYSYEWAIGYNRMADDLLSAPLNDTEI